MRESIGMIRPEEDNLIGEFVSLNKHGKAMKSKKYWTNDIAQMTIGRCVDSTFEL